MNKLIVTRADSNIDWMTEITHPILKRYAEKCEANFIILSENKKYSHDHYRILDVYDLFDEYDRIVSFDSDIFILKTCPNIFETVPENKIGSIYEDRGSRKDFRRSLIQKIQKERGNIGWEEGYINTGVAIFSKQHKEIFNLDPKNLWMDFGQDDVELGYQLNKRKFEVHELPFLWNHMSMFEEGWHNYAPRFDSYIVHYAGQAMFSNIISKKEIMIQDYYLLKKYEALI